MTKYCLLCFGLVFWLFRKISIQRQKSVFCIKLHGFHRSAALATMPSQVTYCNFLAAAKLANAQNVNVASVSTTLSRGNVWRQRLYRVQRNCKIKKDTKQPSVCSAYCGGCERDTARIYWCGPYCGAVARGRPAPAAVCRSISPAQQQTRRTPALAAVDRWNWQTDGPYALLCLVFFYILCIFICV